MSFKPPAYTYSWLHRHRWNVIDLIQLIGRKTVPTYAFADFDMTFVENLRKQLLNLGHKVTVTAILLKAIGIAQRHHPPSRSNILPWGRTVTLNHITAGFTVEKFINGEPSVWFGTINDPDNKSLIEIARELAKYSSADALTEIPQLDLENRFSKMPWLFRQLIWWMGTIFPNIRMRYYAATFGLSSLGKYGITALIPPCVTTSTFGVGQIEPRAVVRDNQIVIRPIMTVVLNFDHLAIDGGPAVRFLQDVKQLIEGGLINHLTLELTDSIKADEAVINFTPPVGSTSLTV